MLGALEAQLMRHDLFTVFCEEYKSHMAEIDKRQNEQSIIVKDKRKKLNKEKDNIIKAITQGIPADVVKPELDRIMRELGIRTIGGQLTRHEREQRHKPWTPDALVCTGHMFICGSHCGCLSLGGV